MTRVFVLLLLFVCGVQAGTFSKYIHRTPANIYTGEDQFTVTFTAYAGPTTPAGTYYVVKQGQPWYLGNQVYVNAQHQITGGGSWQFFVDPIANTSNTAADVQTITHHYTEIRNSSGVIVSTISVNFSASYSTANDSAGNTMFTDSLSILLPGGEEPCPPRDLTFLLDASIQPSTPGSIVNGNLVIQLIVDGGVKANYQYPVRGTFPGAVALQVTEGPVHTATGAFTYSWKINGATVASGSYDCGDEIPQDTVEDTVTYQLDTPPDDETSDSTEVTQDTPGGETTTTTTTTTTPGGDTTTTTTTTTIVDDGTTTDVTKQDFYDVIYTALIDAGNTGQSTTPAAYVPVDGGEDAMAERGRLDDVQTAMEAAKAASDDLRDGLLSKADFTGVLENLPTLGTVSTINFGTISGSGQSFPLVVDLSWASSGIGLLRAMLLFISTVLFVLKCVGAVAEAL